MYRTIQEEEEACHYHSSEEEIDRYDAELYGETHPEMAWIGSSYGGDTYYPNPYYTGKPVPHPLDHENFD